MKYWFVILFVFSICTSQGEGYIDSTKVRNPGLAWKLGVIPGMGQLYNRKYLKTIWFMSAEYFAVSRFIELKKENRIVLFITHKIVNLLKVDKILFIKDKKVSIHENNSKTIELIKKNY